MELSDCFSYQNTEGSLSLDPLDLLINRDISFDFHSFLQAGKQLVQLVPLEVSTASK